MRKKLKILYVHPSLNIGGAENLRLLSLRHMDLEKYDISVCCIEKRGSLAEEIERMGIKVDCLNKPSFCFNLFTAWALFKYINSTGFDIVQSSLVSANFHTRIAAKWAKVPITIIEEHSDYERYKPGLGILFRSLNRYMFGSVDKILTCSKQVASSLSKEEKIPIDSYFALYNAIDVERFQRTTNLTDGLRDEFGISKEEKIIVNVASLAPRKGHIYLLQAFKKLTAAFTGLKLLLVGKGPLRSQLERFVSRHGLNEKVIFTGFRTDIPDILDISDIFVSASVQEGFGINLIEAMYMGVPCVATNVGGIPEVVKNGSTGILVSPANPEALTKAISELLDKPEFAKDFGRAGKERVLENFTADKYIEKLENLYDELLAKKMRRAK